MDSQSPITDAPGADGGSLDRFAFLASMGEELATGRDLEEGLSQAINGVARCLGSAAGTIMLFDDRGAGLTCLASAGPADLRGVSIPLSEPMVARCLRDNAVIARFDPLEEQRFPESGTVNAIPVKSVIFAPIGIGVLPMGVFCVLNKHGDDGYTAGDKVFLRAAAAAIAMSIHNSRLSAAIVDQDRTRRDLELAADIQRNLLPKSDPATSPVNGINRPARLVSGDFFDYIALPDGRIPFALGDVSGKGMNAALLMTKTASLFRCLAKSMDDPAALLKTINREICETVSRGMFVTMVAGVYDPVSGDLRFANAGHEPPLLRLPDRSYKKFPADAPPIGILPDLELETIEANLGGGEFYIFTDGLTEFGYGDDEMLGVKGLIQMVEVSSGAPLATRLRDVLSELDQDGWEARDDLTVLTIDGAWVPRHG